MQEKAFDEFQYPFLIKKKNLARFFDTQNNPFKLLWTERIPRVTDISLLSDTRNPSQICLPLHIHDLYVLAIITYI